MKLVYRSQTFSCKRNETISSQISVGGDSPATWTIFSEISGVRVGPPPTRMMTFPPVAIGPSIRIGISREGFPRTALWEGGYVRLHSVVGDTVDELQIDPGRTNTRLASYATKVPPDGEFYLIAQIVYVDDQSQRQEKSIQQSAEQSTVQAQSQVIPPNDVQFRFPRLRNRRPLWAKASLLSSSSHYFETLLSSAFVEGVKISSKSHGKRKHAEVEADDSGFPDSDDETDTLFPEPDVDEAPTSPSDSFHRIDITQAAYTTYAAVLCWLETGYIDFAPLSSNFPASAPSSTAPTETADTPSAPSVPSVPSVPSPRFLALETSHQSSPLLPIRPSPKSIYRLADFLELPSLQAQALESFKSQLTTSNVMYELVSDVSRAYPDVQQVAFDFAKKHWAEVKTEEGIFKVRKMLEADELPGSVGGLLVRLLM